MVAKKKPKLVIAREESDKKNIGLVGQTNPKLLKIDIGCGTCDEEGWKKCDVHDYKDLKTGKNIKLDYRFDCGKDRWPFKDESVDEARAHHVLEHLDGFERCHFVNELWRILKTDAKCRITVPHWASSRAYGDPTHKWPPVGEFWMWYLNRKWRIEQAPTVDASTNPSWGGFNCNFHVVPAYTPNPILQTKSREFGEFALQYYREMAMDLHLNLTKYPYDKEV
jgi:hypothetical protein